MKNLTNPIKVVNILSDGLFHSGEELAENFGITRAGINKYIKLIREWGIELESVKGKGYKLRQRLDLLNSDKIIHHYQKLAKNNQLNLDIIPVIDSTNQHLLNKIFELKSGDACVAEYQKAGRGRRGKQWYSPFGSNLYFSMYWNLAQGPAATMGLSLTIGIIVAQILNELSGQNVKVKWPNDLYLNDKKLAGILVEMVAKTGDVAHIVIGMGINMNMNNPNQNIVNQAWENLGNIDRNLLVATLLKRLREVLVEFEQSGFSPFLNQWLALDNFADRPVKLLVGDNVIKGIARGVNEQGALLLEQNGKITPYIGGEISLRADK